MHGVMHVTLRSMVIKHAGREGWAEMLEEFAEGDEDSIVALRQHDDALSLRLVRAASNLLGVSEEIGLRLLGGHFIAFLHENDNLDFIRSYGPTIVDCLKNVNELHDRYRDSGAYKHSSFPSVHVQQGSEPGKMIVGYSSSRGALLAPLTEGIVTAAALRVHRQRVTMTRLPTAQEGFSVSWHMSIEDIKEGSEGDRDSVVSGYTGGLSHDQTHSAPRTAPSINRAANDSFDLSAFERKAAAMWHTALTSLCCSAGPRGKSREPPAVHPQLTDDRLEAPTDALESAQGMLGAGTRPSKGGRTTMAGTFVKPPLELEYKSHQLHQLILHDARKLGLVLAVLVACWTAQEAATAVAFRHTHGALLGALLVIACLLATNPVSTYRAKLHLQRVPLSVVEAGLPAALALISVLTTVATVPARDGAPAPDGAAAAAELGLRDDSVRLSLLLKEVAFAVLVGVYSSTELIPFAAFQIVSFAATLSAFCTLPSPPFAQPLVARGAILTLVVLAIIFRSIATRMAAHRRQWHLARSVVKAADQWQRLKSTEVEMHFRQANSQAASAARSKLIRVVMHDLRSPLLTVLSVAKGLVAHPPLVQLDDAYVGKSLDAMLSCTQLMENVVGDMLDFERIDSGRLKLAKTSFTARELLSQAESAFSGLAHGKGITIDFKPIPRSMIGRRYRGDLSRLLQCLSNGISNACKFTAAGGSITVIAFESDSAKQGFARLHIQVKDTGVGLLPNELEKLHAGDVFSQVGQGQLQGRGGTGLGLTIVRHILKLHDASDLLLSSTGRNEGTTFELRLNLALSKRRHGAKSMGSGQLNSRFSEAAQDRFVGRRCSDGSSHAEGSFQSDSPAPAPPPIASRAHSSMELNAAHSLQLEEASTDDPTPPMPRKMHSETDAHEARLHPPAEVMPAAPPATDVMSAEPEVTCLCLHVEDDPMLQWVFDANLFQGLGFPRHLAQNGQEALDMIEKRAADGEPPYSIIIMDNQMPVMVGSLATERIRAMGHTMPIVGITGDPVGSPDRLAFEASGLDHCVDKTSTGIAFITTLLQEQLALERNESLSRRTSTRTSLRSRTSSRAASSTFASGTFASGTFASGTFKPLPERDSCASMTEESAPGIAAAPAAQPWAQQRRSRPQI